MFRREKSVLGGHVMTTERLNDRQGRRHQQHPKPQRQRKLRTLWRRKRTSARLLNKKGDPVTSCHHFPESDIRHITSDNDRRKASY